MHKTRIITGFMLALIAIWAAFGFSNFWFQALTAFLITLAAWEWCNLARFDHLIMRSAYIVVIWLAMYLGLHYLKITLIISLIFWIGAFILLWFPINRLNWLKHKSVLFIFGLLFLAPTWTAMVSLHAYSHQLLFYLILVVCLGDTGAYFVGTHFGKHKLSPKISPKKTVEGLIGALIIGSIAGMIMSLFIPEIKNPAQYLIIFLLGLAIILISIIGDLFESLIKRKSNIKDSGQLLPGHGGILDRIDSLSAATPIFLLCCLWLGLLQ